MGFISMNFGLLTGFAAVGITADLSLDSCVPIIASDCSCVLPSALDDLRM